MMEHYVFVVFLIGFGICAQVRTPPSQLLDHPDSERLQYEFVKYTRKQGENRKTESKGIRPNQRTLKCDCPSFVRVIRTKVDGAYVLQIKSLNLHHENHPTDVAIWDLDKMFEGLPVNPVKNHATSQGKNVILCHFTNLRSEESFQNVKEKRHGRFCVLSCFSIKSLQDDVEGRAFDLCMNLEPSTIERQLTSASDPLCFYFQMLKVVWLNKSEEEVFRSVIEALKNKKESLVDCAILLMPSPDSCQICRIKNISVVRTGEFASFADRFRNCLLLFKCGTDAYLDIKKYLLKNISFPQEENVLFKDKRQEKSFRFMEHHKPFLIKKERDLRIKTKRVSILGKRRHSITINNEGSAVLPLKRVRKEASKPLFSKFNSTAYERLIKQEELKRRLRRESEWAYLCVVFIILLILFSIWIMRGFHSRTAKKREVRHDDNDHYLTVKEVLYRRARYLPMFNRSGDFEEVFVHDCGTNP